MYLSVSRTVMLVVLCLGCGKTTWAATCLYVSSYHQGYEWNDGIERGMEAVLHELCTLQKFYIDTKRNKGEAFAQQKALEAKTLIEVTKPYFKDAAIPFVFCGVNWTAEPYGFPYTNVTGMIEVSPIKPLLKEMQHTVKGAKYGVFLAADVPTQHKEFARIQKTYEAQGVSVSGVFVSTLTACQAAYTAAQQADFIMVSNVAGIDDWNQQQAAQYAFEHARTFSMTTYEWMLPFTMFAMAKVAEEQGEWAAQVAAMIVAGTKPQQIPIVANRRWNMYVNPQLLEKAGITLPDHIMHKAVKASN